MNADAPPEDRSEISVRRLPCPPLRPFVKRIWIASHPLVGAAVRAPREHVLPSGTTHLVIRLSEEPIRLFSGPRDSAGTRYGHSVVGGARSEYYVKDVSAPSLSIGVELLPGSAALLFGASADELAQRHTCLDSLWGRDADLIRERLLEARDAGRRMAELEAVLLRRLPSVHGLHPAIAFALERLSAGEEVRETVRLTGYSHRHFIDLFRSASGLSPKAYSRVVRFQAALQRASALESWAHIAADAGYSDQSHFNREFHLFTGLTPGDYRRRRIAPSRANHVPVEPVSRSGG